LQIRDEVALLSGAPDVLDHVAEVEVQMFDHINAFNTACV